MDVTFYVLSVGYLCSVAAGTLTPAFSFLFGRLTTAFSDPTRLSTRVNECVLYLLYLSIASFIFITLERICVARGAWRRSRRLRVHSLDRFLGFRTANSEAIAAVTLEHIPAYKDGIVAWSNVARHGTTALAGLAVSCYADGLLTALLLAVVVPSLVAVAFFQRLICANPRKQLDEADARTQMVVRDSLPHSKLDTLRSLGIEEVFLEKFAETLPKIRRLRSRLFFWGRISDHGLTQVCFCLAYALVIWRGYQRVRQGKSEPGDVIVVLFASLNAGWSASQAVPALHRVLLGRQAMQHVNAACQLPEDQAELACVEGDDDYSFLSGGAPPRLDIINVTFSFESGNSAINAASFVCLPRHRVAVCGSSGSGKSTLLSLLTLMNRPDSGNIVIDGFDVGSIPGEIWRRDVISYVPQETVLFRTTVFDNVALGAANVTLKEVVRACENADAHTFISKLANGYDTVLDEASLSGGQRQRIGIARAFLKDARVWLLDEWSSALDSATEYTVGQALASVDATMVSIAHKPKIIRDCDSVVVLHRGCVVGNGTHEQLLDENEPYRRLVMSAAHIDEDDCDVGEEQPIVKPRQSLIQRNSVRLSIIPDSIKGQWFQKSDAQYQTQQPSVIQESAPDDRRIEWWLYLCSSVTGVQNTAYAIVMAFVLGSLVSEESLVQYAFAYIAIGFGSLLVVGAACLAEANLVSVTEVVAKAKLFASAIALPFEWKTAYPWTMTVVLLSDTRDLAADFFSRRSTMGKLACATVASLATSFISCPKLAAVIVTTAPLHVVIRLLEANVEASASNDNSITEADTIAIQISPSFLYAVKTMSYAPSLISRLDKVLKDHEARTNRLEAIGAAIAGGASFFVLNTVGLSIWWGTRLILAGSVNLADMMMSFLASYFFLSFDLLLLGRILGRPVTVEQAKMSELLALTQEEENEQAKLTQLLSVEGAISFESVTFGYPNTTRLVLKHFSLQIPARSSIALVGASGHGKSSVLSLIQARYSPLQGKVLLDGVDISRLARSFLVSTMNVVSQEPVIFETGTIIDNIMYGSGLRGRPKTLEDVMEACRAASVHETILALYEGYNTPMKDLGLSGGQRQRLAIARALLSPRPITLLDEPTAALDSGSEAAVVSALDKLVVSGESTVIAVAHRLSTVRAYDRIACVYRGRVLESGTHNELMEIQGGYYQHLYLTSS